MPSNCHHIGWSYQQGSVEGKAVMANLVGAFCGPIWCVKRYREYEPCLESEIEMLSDAEEHLVRELPRS